MCLQCKSFESAVERVQIALKQQFFSFFSVFYPFEELSAIFIKFEMLSAKSVWKSLEFVVTFGC